MIYPRNSLIGSITCLGIPLIISILNRNKNKCLVCARFPLPVTLLNNGRPLLSTPFPCLFETAGKYSTPQKVFYKYCNENKYTLMPTDSGRLRRAFETHPDHFISDIYCYSFSRFHQAAKLCRHKLGEGGTSPDQSSLSFTEHEFCGLIKTRLTEVL